MYYTIVLWDIVTCEFYRLVLCLCFDTALVARESMVVLRWLWYSPRAKSKVKKTNQILTPNLAEKI